MKNVYDFWEDLSAEQIEGVRKIEKKYGDNRWWESEDPLVVIEHQVRERFFMMSFIQYSDALGNLLERPVCHLDFAFHNKRLHEEIDLAVKNHTLKCMAC